MGGWRIGARGKCHRTVIRKYPPRATGQVGGEAADGLVDGIVEARQVADDAAFQQGAVGVGVDDAADNGGSLGETGGAELGDGVGVGPVEGWFNGGTGFPLSRE